MQFWLCHICPRNHMGDTSVRDFDGSSGEKAACSSQHVQFVASTSSLSRGTQGICEPGSQSTSSSRLIFAVIFARALVVLYQCQVFPKLPGSRPSALRRVGVAQTIS